MSTQSLLSHLHSDPNMSEEEARALQDAFREEHGLSGGEVSDKINAAARLLMTGDHEGAIVAYTLVMKEHPEEQDTCEGQIGASYYFLGKYEKALEFYRAAKEHGANADKMDDNIKEAEEAIEKVARGEDPNEEGGTSPIVIIALLAVFAGAVYFLIT